MANTYKGGILPISTEIATVLRDEIFSGQYAVGQRLENERKLIERFHVSRGAVRRALHVLEQERLIVRQQGRGTFVCDLSQASSQRRTTTLVAMVYERQYFFDAVIRGACSLASQRGYLLATASNATEAEETANVDMILRDQVAGVLLTPRGQQSRKSYDRLVEAGTKVVLVDTFIPGCNENFAGENNAQGIFMAVGYLAELGHKQIGYVGHDDHDDRPCKAQRLCGFMDGCTHAGLVPADEWIIQTDKQSCGRQLTELLSSPQRPTGIVAYNDFWAIRVIATARQLGLRVPEDLSVIGFDDCILASSYDVPVTSVCPHYPQIGMAAVELLMSNLEKESSDFKRSVLITPTITPRASTGPAPD